MKEHNKNNTLWAGSDVVAKAISLGAGFVEFDLYTPRQGTKLTNSIVGHGKKLPATRLWKS
tara:strand:+ start:320 stop:502 length:183 start_codon:yes stop_codon:yes gene_type:complete